ncbi:TonB-dependent receptor [Mucilaginibacter sp. HMF5004]|uniref:TonB-dependent receptor n=1 Tax=Mucilaginibacter rivuli TaxID=2857527 RepID=UPI001C5DC806|nr:TonB-dependent receptor [Mucilaginibacter rivuli]MBW4891063.1 TonB-dependent receptor [Mucilaginibacter rivuli]
MKYTFLLVAVLLFSLLVKAQTNNIPAKGKISGKITDATNKAPIEYATIAVYKQGSKTPINGSTSDTKGNFSVTNLPYGEYQVAVDFIGYQHYVIDHIILSAAKATVVLNNIAVLSMQKQLGTVNITAQASTIENKIDKLVYNVGNDLTAQGGFATDILKKVPMVTVDIDGNVELLGNPSVKFLINGKPSSIFGASLADALQSIPSSQIKSIEVITSPGAKSPASGTGGIINIILKDNKVQGYNGSVNLSAGTRLENTSVNLNARKVNFGIGAYFSGNQTLRSKTLSNRERTNIYKDTTQNQFQNGYGNTERQGGQAGLELDWAISKVDNLTASLSYHNFSNYNEGITSQEDRQLKGVTPYSDIQLLRNSNSRFGENAFDASVEYKKSFKKEWHELTIAYNFSYNRNNGNYYQKVNYINQATAASGSTGDNPGRENESEISVDYAYPVTEDIMFETGAKLNIYQTNSISNVNTFNPAIKDFVFDPLQSTNFTYGRNVYAYYVSTTFPLFNFLDVKLGLRDEYTTTTVDFPGTNIPDYNFLSPSVAVSHKINKTQSIKFGYSKRIERPDFGDINPFINYNDPYNIQYGNPNLHPEIGNNFEIGYNRSFEQGSNINITTFYRHNGFDVKQYSFRVDSLLETGGKYYKNVYIQTRANVGSEVTIGINLSSSIQVTDKFTIRPNIITSQRRVMVNLPNVPAFVMGYETRLNLNAGYQFKNNLAAEAFVNYSTPRVGLQGTNSSFIAYNFAVRKQFWNKKASLGLTATVPFNEYVDQTSTILQTQPNYSYQHSVRQVPFRSFGITFSYRFGKLEFKKDKNKDGNPNLPQPDQGY